MLLITLLLSCYSVGEYNQGHCFWLCQNDGLTSAPESALVTRNNDGNGKETFTLSCICTSKDRAESKIITVKTN